MPFAARIVIALAATAALFASLSIAATFGIVLLLVSGAVLWMSFIYLMAQRVAPRRIDARQRFEAN